MKIKRLRNGILNNELFFTSDYGEGQGTWHGLSPFPENGELEVEFELVQLLMRWVDIIPADKPEFRISMEGKKVFFTGVLDNIEEDGTGYLRIGDSLMMFESLGEPMMLGSYVQVVAEDVRIYPVAL